jgi:hypothetical protein
MSVNTAAFRRTCLVSYFACRTAIYGSVTVLAWLIYRSTKANDTGDDAKWVVCCATSAVGCLACLGATLVVFSRNSNPRRRFTDASLLFGVLVWVAAAVYQTLVIANACWWWGRFAAAGPGRLGRICAAFVSLMLAGVILDTSALPWTVFVVSCPHEADW